MASRIASAFAVVGPLAPSQMIFALIVPAFLLVITFSSAAGTSTSQVELEDLLVGRPASPFG
ncbi:MAG: hypothetical protein V9E87_16430 [Gemmatimonadales bacterium]